MKGQKVLDAMKRSLSLFRLRSVFFKILLLLTVSIVGFLGLFYLVIRENYQQSIQEQQINAGFAALNLSGNQVEEKLTMLESRIGELLDVAALEQLVLPGDIFSNPEAIEVVRKLKNMADDEPWIEKAFLYVRSDNALLSSDQTVKPLEETDEYDVLYQYQQMETETQFLLLEGDIYLFEEIPKDRWMAVCVLKLDHRAFYEDFSKIIETLELDFPVFPFWGDMPLFDRQMSYPDASEFMIVSRTPQNYGDELCARPNSEGFLLVHQLSGLNIRLFGLLDEQSDLVPLQEILITGMPIWMVSILLIMLVGVALIVVVYRPLAGTVNDLLSLRAPGASSPVPADVKNEFELITGLFQEQKNYEEELSSLLKKTGIAVTNHILLDIISAQQDEETVKKMLLPVRESFDIDLTYQIFLITVLKDNAEPLSAMEQEMNRILIREWSLNYWREKAQLNILSKTEYPVILVLGFQADLSSRQLKQWQEEYAHGCEERLRRHDCLPALGSSLLHSRVCTLADAFTEAKADQKKCLYYNGISHSETKDIVESYKSRVHLCLEHMVREPETAKRELSALLESSRSYPEYANQILMDYMDSTLECLLRYRVPCQEHWLAWRDALSVQPADKSEEQRQQDIFRCFFEETTAGMNNAAGQIQRQYLDQAERYIRDHYGDSNLSLAVVSENCGISKGYLSRLFIQYSNDSFTDHLNEYRVNRACELLCNTSFTISDVGLKTGFNSPQSFNRVFKRYMNCTPTQYRVQWKRSGTQ